MSTIPKSTRLHRQRRAAHLCVVCGSPAIGARCEKHRRLLNVRVREWRRTRLGFKSRYLNAESYSFQQGESK